MSEFVSIPLKKTNDVDLVKPFKALLLARSSTSTSSDKRDDFSDAIGELNRLRQSATSRAIEKQESYLEIMSKYHDQLLMLESKFPPQDITIPFKWKDAFDKGSLFGGKLSLTITSLTWERFCVLYNVAALQSQIGAIQNVHSDEGLKTASRLFQQAAGIFQHLKSILPVALGPNEPTPDVQPDCLTALSALMLAQGQEAIVMKAINDKMKDATVAKLASQASEFYSEAQKLMQKETVRNNWDRDWPARVSARNAFYSGVAQYYQSRVCNAEKQIGEEIARCQAAIDQLKIAYSRFSVESAPMSELCTSLLEKANRALADAKKDNDFIYHDRVPPVDSLAPVPKAAMAKAAPVQGRLNPNIKDLFDGLAPVAVQQAVQSYEARKAELVNMEIGRLREANQLLNGVLASLNLPAALEDTQGESLPPSLKERAAAVRNAGGKDAIEKQLKELPEMLTRNDEILSETERMLREEKSSDDQLRAQFGAKWIRTSSDGLTERFRTDLQKYRNIINTARTADGVVRAKYEGAKHGIELMSLPEAELASKLPHSPGSMNASGPLADRLRELMKVVNHIQWERENLEKELASKTADMKAAFMVALHENDGQMDEETISARVLAETYGAMQAKVKENLQQQQNILGEIEKVAAEWIASRGSGDNARDNIMKELASAHDMFVELTKNLNEGAKFYTDLTQLLVVFQSKVSDFCFARRTEKEELLKDLTSSLASSQMESPPNAPSHHDNTKQTPPRPPPPHIPSAQETAASAPQPQAGPSPYQQGQVPYNQQSLPYPVHVTGMPLPTYNQGYPPYTQVPMPPQNYTAYTPMPGGYNPYAAPTYQTPGQQFTGAPHIHGYVAPAPQPPYMMQPPQYQRPW